MARISNNWADGIKKPYEGKTKEVPVETVWFMVFGVGKSAKVGLNPKKVEEKTQEWDKNRVGYKRIES